MLFAAALACLFLVGVSSARAQSGNAQIPEPTGRAVNDFANIIDADTEQRLETILTNLKREKQIEFGVVTVRTTGGKDIFDYALEVGRKWGIGPESGDKEGLLLLVAVDDRKYHTLVSRHLQGELTDSTVGSLQRQYLVPAFRESNYGKGVYDTIRAYIDTLATKRGFSTTGIYPQNEPTQPRPQRPTGRTRTPTSGGGVSTCCAIIFILVIIIILFSSNRGGGGGGCLNMLLLGSLLNMGSRGGSSWGDSGWSGGGWGGGGGDSGGGFGGFGGGGDFDGGGAGGSW